MAERWFLKLDGIAGESTHEAHKGEIDIEAWSFGVTRDSPASSGSGRGVGRPDFDDFHFVSRLSSASPPLLLACATGSHIKEALLSGVKQSQSAKAGSDFLKYRLADVQVTGYHQSGADDDSVPTDQFSLSYAKIEVTYTPTNASGKAGKSIKAAYDLKSAKKI
jgi:type VI secretion system secreted protein Hcp